MKKTFRSVLSASIMSAVAYIALGLVLIIWPGITMASLVYIGAGILMVTGIIEIIKYLSGRMVEEGSINNYLAIGLIMILLGVFMLLRTELIIKIIPFVLGFAILIDGIIKLQRSIDLARMHFEGWIFVLIIAAISIALGVVMVTRPIDTAQALAVVLGIGLLFCGITGIVVTVFVRGKIKNLNKDAAIEVEDIAEEDMGTPDFSAYAAPQSKPSAEVASAPADASSSFENTGSPSLVASSPEESTSPAKPSSASLSVGGIVIEPADDENNN